MYIHNLNLVSKFFREPKRIRAVEVKRRRRRANNISVKYETSLVTKMLTCFGLLLSLPQTA